MEYPGYGIFRQEIKNGNKTDKNLSCRPNWIAENAKLVYEYVIRPISQGGLGYKEHGVILFGLSIGTGPAI